ncbi:MAG: uroporphyrinogen-III synthase [Actinomycetota bacterium]|nr:uroporphyrinogen-III synthase [Actinomycetota bacterium]
MKPGGRVYLVGAGPGDPGLITRRGLELLRECDVVVADRLVPPRLLQELKPEAKRLNAPAPADALVKHVRAGRTVVHLAAGDPFSFSPAASEALDLARAGVAVEIVPGISPALAAPAYAGIPLTRGDRGSVTIARDGNVPTGGTVVLSTDENSLRSTVAALIGNGHDSERPTALIEWGTTPSQRTLVAPLAEIADRAAAAKLRGPLVAVVGDVVALREQLAWFEKKPLFGLRVVVTRAGGQSGKLTAQLEALGAAVVEMPVISIRDPASWHELDQSIRLLDEGFFKWVIFTSANAVEKVFARLEHASLDARAFGRVRVAAVGSSTAGLLAQRGIRADLVPAEFTGASVAKALGRGSGRILLPRVQGAPEDLVDALSGAGWNVREVVAYRNVPARKDSLGAAVVESGRYDVVTFTSASTVRSFVALAGTAAGRGVACIGPVTAEAARESGLTVDVVSGEHTVEGLVRALVERFGRVAP